MPTEASHPEGYLLLLLLLRLLRQRHVGLVKIVAEVPRSVSIHLRAYWRGDARGHTFAYVG